MGIAEQAQQIARVLNEVKTIGQARGAVRACIASLNRMIDEVTPAFWHRYESKLRDSIVGGPATDSAIRDELTMIRTALGAEGRLLVGDDAQPVTQTWERAKRQVQRGYQAIAGAEGARSARPDLAWHLENLIEATGNVAKALAPFAISGAVIALAVVAFLIFGRAR